MHIDRRNCIKHDEEEDMLDEAGVIMEVFQNYSRRACLIECRGRHMYDECGCIPYYYPNFGAKWELETACDLDGLKCIATNAREWQSDSNLIE